MGLKKEIIPLKNWIIVGIIEAIFIAISLGLWDYFKGEELYYFRYIVQGVLFAFIMSFMFFKYKIVEEKEEKNASRFWYITRRI